MFIPSTFSRTAIGTAGALCFATLCLGTAAAPAAASTPASVAVRTADLNLGHPQGRALLAARIKVAARAVCVAGGSDTVSRGIEIRCVKAAIADATRS